MISKQRTGELLIFAEALLWAMFPVMTKLTLGNNIDPLWTAAIASFTASLFFGIILTLRSGWRVFQSGYPWRDTFIATVLIGVVFYSFFFIGLGKTTAGNGAIISQMEVFFSFLILGLLVKHEPLIKTHVIGGICMVAGALLILFPKASGWHTGDLLILIGTAFPPIGNKYMQAARRRVSAESILFIRSFISGIFLIVLALLTETVPSSGAVARSFPALLLNGVLLLGLSKILWVEGTIRLPITKCISLASISPFFTLLFAYAFLNERIEGFQIAAMLPMMLGILLLMDMLPSGKRT